MALINCPECGREHVSGSAEMCPECGYGIKAHFDKIRQEEEEKEQIRKEGTSGIVVLVNLIFKLFRRSLRHGKKWLEQEEDNGSIGSKKRIVLLQ